MELYLVVQVVLGGLLLAALVWGRDSLLWVSGFLIPLYGMSAFVGVRLTWDKAIPVALAIDLLVRGGAGRALRMPGRLPLFLLLGYTAIISGCPARFVGSRQAGAQARTRGKEREERSRARGC